MRHAIRSACLGILAATALTGLAGCGGSDDPVSPVIPPAVLDSLPPRGSPGGLVVRFEAVYEFESLVEYGRLLSENYRFTFSNQADPNLVSIYGNNWGKSDEIASTGHLFGGFTNDVGEYQPAAAAVQLSLNGLTIGDDPDHPDSVAWYRKAICPSLDAQIDINGGETYSISAPQELYLVRGDAAVLAVGQEARADVWYLHRWVDKSAPLAAALLPARNVTWGGLKARYR